MDKIDIRLCALLQDDSGRSRAELADIVGLSTAACAKRITRLWNEGYIEKNSVTLNRAKFAKTVEVIVMVTLQTPKANIVTEFERTVRAHDHVRSLVAMSGEYDYMIEISALSIEDFFSFASEVLGQMSSVRNYQSQFILKRIKDDPRLPQFVLDEAVSV